MRILIAEDDPVGRRLLEVTLRHWGYDVVVTEDGDQAHAALQAPGAPDVAILDWMMPGLDGAEVCRRLRAEAAGEVRAAPYLILLTARGESADRIAGLEAGADDYICKPFDSDELRARLRVAERVAGLQRRLAERVGQLEQALTRVHRLQGLLPICVYCKSIRNDDNFWQRVEEYLADHAATQFSHGICPDCYDRVVKSSQGDALGSSPAPLRGEPVNGPTSKG
jgi:sigma-B regulation protein RsbU (phosphoserine phosphatase)